MKKLIAVLLMTGSMAGTAHADGRWHGGWGGGWRGEGWRGEGWRGGWGGWDEDRAWWFGSGLVGGMALAQPVYVPPPVYYAPPPVYVAPPPRVVIAQPPVTYASPGRITYGPTTYYNGYGPGADN
ncbi:MAG: hypothetical protein ACYCZR_02725 [Burkholderiales bacterium]